jgi:hypothetical protein
VDPHQDQSDVAGTVAALAGIKKSGNLIFGQGAAAGVVHEKKILPPKPARFQKLNFAENVKLPLLPKPEVIQERLSTQKSNKSCLSFPLQATDSFSDYRHRGIETEKIGGHFRPAPR